MENPNSLLNNVLRFVGESPDATASVMAVNAAFAKDPTATNAAIDEACEKGFFDRIGEFVRLSDSGTIHLEPYKVKNAIILAAGTGSRMLPLTIHKHKGLLRVWGEPMIERQIKQLLERGIEDITLVTGHLAEQFDYLVARYGVKLVFNPEFAEKNNLASILRVKEKLGGTYILVADNWLKENLYHKWEFNSWMFCEYSPEPTKEWIVDVDQHDRITEITVGGEKGWYLEGPCYLDPEFGRELAIFVDAYYPKESSDDFYWEDIVMRELDSLPPIYRQNHEERCVFEFETLADLRAADGAYLFESDDVCLSTIASVFKVPQYDITGFQPVKKGMTNRSFIFSVNGEQYVYRNPGVGTDQLINRRAEKQAYDLSKHLGITDEVVYLDPETGVKISKYFHDVKLIDLDNIEQVEKAFELSRQIHELPVPADGLKFDIGERLAHYYRLLNNADPKAIDAIVPIIRESTRLLEIRDNLNVPLALCQVDFVQENLLVLPTGEVKVIDWEYSGLADPLIDLAQFSMYTWSDRERIDNLLAQYLGREPDTQEYLRLYLHVALTGLLWYIWTLIKAAKGVYFGDYAQSMLKYFTDFQQIITTEEKFREYITSS